MLDINFEHTFIHSGQNIGNNMKEVFFDDLELRRPDFEWQADASSLAAIIGSTMLNMENFIKANKPDALVTLGDTNSALAGIIARRYGVTTYHIEAGNRSFDGNVPEEVNRKIVDHFSTFNLAYSVNAYNNLMREGLHPRFTTICGSPMLEVINQHINKIRDSKTLNKLGLKERSYFLVSAHRQENVDNPKRLKLLWESLNRLSDTYGIPSLVSLHPRTKSQLDKLNITPTKNIILHEPFGFIDYMSLQENAFCVLSDSGTISEESSILKFPAITLRDSIERPEALETGAIALTGLEFTEIHRGVKLATNNAKSTTTPEAYLVDDHSRRVASFIQSTASRSHEWTGLRKFD
jgi:UDP-N-acetylglucosamine 2-epimerase (non-hydrolysing)